jgi:hypothetical protein
VADSGQGKTWQTLLVQSLQSPRLLLKVLKVGVVHLILDYEMVLLVVDQLLQTVDYILDLWNQVVIQVEAIMSLLMATQNSLDLKPQSIQTISSGEKLIIRQVKQFLINLEIQSDNSRIYLLYDLKKDLSNGLEQTNKHKNRGFEKAAPVFVFWDAK